MERRSTVRRVLMLVFALALFAVVPGALANGSELVENGGFEAPVPSGSWDIFPEDEVPGWTVEWVDPDAACGGDRDPVLEIQKSGTVVTAFEGNQYAELDTDCQPTTDVSTNVRISQDLDLAAGNYNLGFAWQQRTTDDRMLVNAGAESSSYGMAGNATAGWTEETVVFDAVEDETTISFEESDTPDNSLGMFLDGVCVTCNYLVFDLIAGQHEDVGSVLVWDDGANIYVKYMVVAPWMIEEIHLAVGATPSDIPGNKGGPIPGKFPIKEYFDPLTSMAPMAGEGEYTIPFDEVLGGPVAAGEPVTIAAHAVVWNTASEVTVTAGFYSDGVGDGGTTMVTAGNVDAAVYPYAAVDAWEAFDDPADTGPSFWDAALLGYVFQYGDWIWESYRVDDPTTIQNVTFEHKFDVSTFGYVVGPIMGEVHIADDNMYSAEMNSELLGAQTVVGGWKTVGNYTFTPDIGENVLTIVGTNYGDSSYNLQNNPAGLIFEGSYSYDTYEHEETAWGSDGDCDLSGSNWALCLTYVIGDCDVSEEVPE